jgi:hypothetical protein
MTVRRTLLIAVTSFILAASACLALNHWTAVDLVNYFEEGQRVGALDQRIAAGRDLLSAKNEVLNELLAGRLTLRQAAARFGELDTLMQDGNDELVGPFRVVQGEEALCRCVLGWAETALYWRGDEANKAKVMARLKEEYRRRFGHDPRPWTRAVGTEAPPE